MLFANRPTDSPFAGGYLLLGHSESLINLSTSFEVVRLREDLVYRKPLAAAFTEAAAPSAGDRGR